MWFVKKLISIGSLSSEVWRADGCGAFVDMLCLGAVAPYEDEHDEADLWVSFTLLLVSKRVVRGNELERTSFEAFRQLDTCV